MYLKYQKFDRNPYPGGCVILIHCVLKKYPDRTWYFETEDDNAEDWVHAIEMEIPKV